MNHRGSAVIYPNRFQGRTAIVTGGAAGIGLAVAARLTAEGANCCLWDLNEAALAQARAQVGAAAVQALDVSDPAQVDAAMQASLGSRLDILVAAAGITGPNATVRDYPVDA
jgi:2-dehydro-3-deoxy-L-rhamnonate dehydrogenase (NAD+)